MDRRSILTLLSGLVFGTFFIGCVNNQPIKEKEPKIVLQEEGVVENIKCLDDSCFSKELTVNLVQERVKVKVNVKNKQKYQKGQLILIKVK